MSNRKTDGGKQRMGAGDLVWGLAAGGIGIGIVVMAVLIIQGGFSGGSGGGSCDKPLASLGQSPVTAEEFQAVDDGLEQVVAAANLGALAGAENSFFGRVHSFTHNVDPPLRQTDPALAKTLCRGVLALENEFSIGRRTETIATEAESVRQILRQAASLMGLPQPQ